MEGNIMQCLVTGSCGFIGSNLTDRLIDLGNEVIAVDDLSTGCLKNLNPKATFVNCDIREIPNIYSDVIFHLAGLASIPNSFSNPVETIDVNVSGTTKIMELARHTGAKVVYAGSSSFYGDPRINPYALSKWLGEEVCRMYNTVYKTPVSIARFFNVFGNRQRKDAGVVAIFEDQRRRNVPLTPTGTGEQRRDMIHVLDIANCLIAMSQQEALNGEIFNVGSGDNFSINEIAKLFQPIKIEHIPARPGEAWETLADISITKEKLNWQPRHFLADYVQSILDDCVKNPSIV